MACARAFLTPDTNYNVLYFLFKGLQHLRAEYTGRNFSAP